MFDSNLVTTRGLLVGLTGRTPKDSETLLGITTSGQWRWSQQARAWLGPAYAVSWTVGDNVGVPTGPWPGLGHATVQCSNAVGGTPWNSDGDIAGVPQYDFDDNNAFATAATSTASGVIFLIQAEAGFPATPGTPPIDISVLDFLGDVVLTNDTAVVPYAIDTGDGDDTDTVFYLEWDSRLFYQRANGSWNLLGSIADPHQQMSVSSHSAAAPIFEGFGGPNSGADPIADADLLRMFSDTGVGHNPYPQGAGFRVRPNGTVILMGDLPDDAVLANGQMALWFDPTPGASFLRVKAKDSAGTVVTGNLPLT